MHILWLADLALNYETTLLNPVEGLNSETLFLVYDFGWHCVIVSSADFIM